MTQDGRETKGFESNEEAIRLMGTTRVVVVG